MKHIIHDWPDDKATTILRNCRNSVNQGGKLLLVELVIAPGNAADLGKHTNSFTQPIATATSAGPL
jgi:O-methyltransferase domain